MLNFARSRRDASQLRLSDVPVARGGLARGAARRAAARAKRAAHFDAERCDARLAVRADPEKLQQVLLNLLSNAIKFTAAGRPHRGRVRGATTRSRARSRVRDTGIGIPADQLERVFEPFVQVNASLTRAHEGVGLGLAISRDLARGMGGDLTAESAPGEGSTFTLALRAR